MRALLILVLLLAYAPAAEAQVPLKRELGRLSFMLGERQGTGWVKYQPDGPRREARIASRGEARLAGAVLGLSSVATSTDREAAVVLNNDLGVRFRADSSVFRADVQHGSSRVGGWVRASECELAWGYAAPDDPASLFRFTARVDAANRRVETGERSADGGQTWWQFYGAELAGLAGGGCTPSAPAPAAP
jgi:hypothetical protein